MTDDSRELRLQRVLHSYLQALDRGDQPDRQEILAAHPDLADELAEYFADASRLEQMAQSLRTASFDAEMSGATPSLGKVRYFGDYELLEELAHGGMGVVFKARQVSLNRTVALKMILKGELASQADVRRFQQEAEAAANLDHPHIVPIYEVGEHAGQQYFSMKLIEPGRRKEGARGAAETLVKVARAVHHAHQRRILHRDLKPSNILIDLKGEPHVADFGLAKKVEGGEQATHSGAIVGTPAYMAPEQARAEKSLTTAVDVYSLGGVLYAWLTGQPPFRGEDPLATLIKVTTDEPIAPRKINPNIDRDLEIICLKCLQKEPARRYGSAEALAEDLECWLTGRPIAARPSGAWERGQKWVRRRPAAAALLGLSLLVLGCLAFIYWQVNEAELKAALGKIALAEQEKEWAEDKRKEVEKQRDKTLEALTHAEALRLTAEARSHLANNPSLALLLAVEGAERGKPRHASHNNTLFAALRAIPEHRVFNIPRNEVGKVRISNDGRFVLAFPDEFSRQNEDRLFFDERPARLWDLANKNAPILLRMPSIPLEYADRHPRRLEFEDAEFSPDGGRVLIRFQGNSLCCYKDGVHRLYTENVVRLWDTATGKELTVLRGHEGRVLSAHFSPDGKQIVTTSTDLSVRLWDPETGKQLARLDGHKCQPEEAAFSADGLKLVTQAIGGFEMLVVAYGMGQKLPAAEVDPLFNGDPQADRKFYKEINIAAGRMASVGEGNVETMGKAFRLRKEMLTWDVVAGKLLETAADKDAPETMLQALRSKGQRVRAEPVRDETVGNIVALRLTDTLKNRPLGVVRGYEGALFDYAVSADGTTVVTASQDGTVRVWPSITGQAFGTSLFPTQESPQWGTYQTFLRLMAWSPDSQRVLTTYYVTGSAKGLAGHIWDVAAGKQIATLRLEDKDAEPDFCAFSPDSRDVLVSYRTYGRSPKNKISHPPGVYDADSGRKRFGLPVHAVRYSPDGRTLVSWSFDDEAPSIRLWDAKTGKPLQVLVQGSEYAYAGASWLPDSQHILVTISYRKAILFDVATASPLREFTLGEKDHHPTLSPDGRRLLTRRSTSKGYECVLWDIGTGKQLALLPGQQLYNGFSNDSRFFATFDQNSATVWRQEDGQLQAVLRGHTERVDGYAFSPDGNLIVTWARDSVRIWRTEDGKEFFRPTEQTSTERCMFSPDGRWLLTRKSDLATLWPVDPLAAARARRGRALTQDERERFETGLAVPPASCVDVPSNVRTPYAQRGRFLAEGGHWKRAGAEYVQALPQYPDDVQLHFEAACVLLKAGDNTAYQQLCKALVERLQPVANRYEAAQLARICALAPGLDEKIIEIAAAMVGKEKPKEAYEKARLGALLFRLRRHEEAAKRLSEVRDRDAITSLFQAMALHHLERTGESKECFDEATRKVAQLSEGTRLEEELLQAEAKRTLQSSK